MRIASCRRARNVLRVLLAELERLYNHLHYLGHLCHTTTLKVGEAEGKFLEEHAKQLNTLADRQPVSAQRPDARRGAPRSVAEGMARRGARMRCASGFRAMLGTWRIPRAISTG